MVVVAVFVFVETVVCKSVLVDVLCLLCLRLLREGSRVVAGTVSFVLAVICRILCRCFGPCRGHVAARSCDCGSREGALCRPYVVVTAVRCDAVAVFVGRSQAGADCGSLSLVVNVLMLRVTRCVLLRVSDGPVGVLTRFGKSSCRSRVESSGVEFGRMESGGVELGDA